jgi:hypothetical protein
MTANGTNQFILDRIWVYLSGGGPTSVIEVSSIIPSFTSMPSSPPIATTRATPVSAIVGGVVGGVTGIAILAIALWCFLRRSRSGGRPYYFKKPSKTDILAGEGLYTFHRLYCREFLGFTQALPDRVEPFNATATTPAPLPAGFSGQGHQGDMTYVSNTTAQPTTGEATHIARQYPRTQQPVQHENSETRVNENEEAYGPSRSPNDPPPSYSKIANPPESR